MKITIKKAQISDKIYFREEDIEGHTYEEMRDKLFSYNTGEKIFFTSDKVDDLISVPSGSFYKLDIQEVQDNRPNMPACNFKYIGSLRDYQVESIQKFFKPEGLYSGLLHAPCSWGKSFSSPAWIAHCDKPTIILCHTKLLAYQWYEALDLLFPEETIGFIGDNKFSINRITVAIYHTVVKNIEKVCDKFELLILDESHLCMAPMFSKVVNSFNVRTKIALTATPWRKDGMHVALPDYFGPNRVVAPDNNKITPNVLLIKTEIPFPIRDPKRDWAKALTKIGSNESYIALIARIARDKIALGRCILIVSERIEMLESIKEQLPNSQLLVGKTKNRDEILEAVGKSVKAILTTKIFDEGISCHRLDTIMLTCPMNNEAKLEQRIGRIQREHPEKKHPLVIDFHLRGFQVEHQQKNRLQWYIKNNFPILNEEY